MNPEFQRYLWLELTPHRLVVAPVLLIAIFALVHLVSGNQSSFYMSLVAYWLVVACGVLWGARVAAEAVASEVRDGTWDQQRLCSLGPWTMTWGKLFGAPVFPWYTSLFAIVVFSFTALTRMHMAQVFGHLWLLASVVIFSHAVGLLVSLHMAVSGNIKASRSFVGMHFLGMVAGLLALNPVYSALTDGWLEPVSWFSMQVNHQVFIHLSIASLLFWSVIACYRMMRAELQLSNAPWVWLGFVIYSMAYVAGLFWASDLPSPWPAYSVLFKQSVWAGMSAYFIAMIAMVAMLFIESHDPVEYRRLFASWRARNWSLVFATIPRWVCVLPLAILMIISLQLSDSRGGAFSLSVMAFFIRDAGIVVLLNLAANRQRANAAALVYLLVLYGLLPSIISAGSTWSLQGWLYPSASSDLLVAVLPALAQAAVIWFFVQQRWQKLWIAVEQS